MAYSEEKYRLSVDDLDAIWEGEIDKEYFDATMIHELGHILTLNDSQMLDKKDESSENYTAYEGTLTKESYLNQYYKRFWMEIRSDWEKFQKKGGAEPEQDITSSEYFS